MKKVFAILLVMLFTVALVVGCSMNSQPQQSPQSPPQDGEEMVLTLYYGDSEIQELIVEERKVTVSEGDNAMRIALTELTKEPKNTHALVLMPLETEVLSVDATEHVIIVNFNEKIHENFYGGSSSEQLLVASIVNTVTAFPGFENHKVQFLVHGESFDSIGGHISAEEQFVRWE